MKQVSMATTTVDISFLENGTLVKIPARSKIFIELVTGIGAVIGSQRVMRFESFQYTFSESN